MSGVRRCPAWLISAPASGQGKTTVTAALARRFRDRGAQVRVFKTGPDFLDPGILERAAGAPVYQLDLWMGGEEHCRRLLYQAAGEADLILLEGVMGLFDGTPSTADLGALFGLPVVAVIDATAMAQTFGAVAQGLAGYRPRMPFAGVIANRVAGPRHLALLAEGMPAAVPLMGSLPREAALAVPSRHLGLHRAEEIDDLDERTACAAALLQLAEGTPAPVEFRAPHMPGRSRLLEGVRIAVAYDAAFSFLYRANLDTLQEVGATIEFFSPLTDSQLPPCDALYLPGGYPELHLGELSGNDAMRQALHDHHRNGKPVVAECGGMLYLLESLTAAGGATGAMAGLLPGRAILGERLAALALQEVDLPEGRLRGHTFHHSRLQSPLTPMARGRCPNGSGTAEAVYRSGRLTASYIHSYFPSNPEAAARLFLP